MGRPLKIAKAQAVLTLTGTAVSGNVITVSGSLTTAGVIAGMPFIPAANVGTGLVAGTTYYVLTVLSATTFTASATDLSSNTSLTPVTQSATSGLTVKLTVGLVGSGFNNPPGASYGVVGGNTNLYGNQILCNVAIGQSGTGTIYTTATDANVYGIGTDFANVLAVGSGLQTVNATTGVATQIGFVTTNTGYSNISVSSTIASNVASIITSTNTNLIVNAPVVFGANIGGLVAGTVYFVQAKADSTHITVSATVGGAAITTTAATVATYVLQDRTILVSAVAASTSGVGFVFSTAEPGYITRQKGKTKYLVTGNTTSITNACYTANVANAALTANTFNILSTYVLANAATGTNYVQSVNDYQSIIFGVDMAANGLATGNPGIIGTFNTAYAANTEIGDKPVVVISNT